MSIIRILIIVVPIILAVLYLPSFLNKINEIFGSLYGGEQFNILKQLQGLNMGGVDLNSLLKGQK